MTDTKLPKEDGKVPFRKEEGTSNFTTFTVLVIEHVIPFQDPPHTLVTGIASFEQCQPSNTAAALVLATMSHNTLPVSHAVVNPGPSAGRESKQLA